jgi:outer membrane protein TolC
MHVCTEYISPMSENKLNGCTGVVLTAIAVLTCCPLAVAQTTSTDLSTLPSAEQFIQRSQDPFAGSIPQGQVSAQPIDLTVSDALDRGLKYNLGLYLSDQATAQSRSARLRALSDLLPKADGSVSEEEQKLNLKAFGLTFPGFPSSVGPFSLFDLRATGSWNPLDLHSFDNVHAASENVKAAQFGYRDARDTVVIAVGANYLLTIANESRVAAAEAELNSAQALYQLAVDQENAGLSPNIDTLRARVQLQAQQETLITARNDLEKQRIALARVIGLPVQQKFRLVNRVPYRPLPEVNLENSYALALKTRPDYQAALASLRAAQFTRSSAWKQRLPSIGFSGEYGVLGFNPSSLSPNWTAAATLKIPFFEGGRIEADIQQSEAVLKQRQAQVANLHDSIEQDVENAILDLNAAAQQVEVATTGLDYAQQALGQSRDRFAAGVTNNVEVIQAQQQLASANDRYIASLYGFNIGKVLLARAIGNADLVVKQYLSESGSTLPNNGTIPTGAPPSSTVPNSAAGNTEPPPAPRPNPTPEAAPRSVPPGAGNSGTVVPQVQQ